jgi:Bacterial Ig-like domain (group 3)/FG-GAP-like repeat
MWMVKYTSGCQYGYDECWAPEPVPGDGISTTSWQLLPISSSLPTGTVLSGKFNGLLSFLVPGYGNGNTHLIVISSNGSLLGSTIVTGKFNPMSANYFDSHLDVAGTYTDSDGNTGVAIFFGNGDGSFDPNPLFIRDPSGYRSQSIYVADFNGDNKLDIVSAMKSSTLPGELEVLLNSTNPKTPTVSVASSLNPSTYGATVTFTATVIPKPLNWPTEKMSFYSGSAELGKVTMVNGIATISTTKLEPGTHTITAKYSGDCCDYLPAAASMSQTVVK